jgi:tetratricopeptide (TPR) repeat protein
MESALERLSDRVALREKEAWYFVRKGNYEAAIAACQEAIGVFEGSPFFQRGPLRTLALVYTRAGRYREALAIWEPMYDPDGDTSQLCGMAICYAKLNRPLEGAKVLHDLLRVQQIRYADESELPFWDSTTSAAVEASAIICHAYSMTGAYFMSSSRPAPEIESDLRRAVELAPRRASANYALADYLESPRRNAFALAEPFYRMAYLYGSPKIKKLAAYRLSVKGKKVAGS